MYLLYNKWVFFFTYHTPRNLIMTSIFMAFYQQGFKVRLEMSFYKQVNSVCHFVEIIHVQFIIPV
jgi:hypothetical protein